MKNLKPIITAFLMLLAISIAAQQGINYKAIVKDGSGNIIANDLIVVQFTILETSSTGTIVYKELHTPSTDVNGIIIINIGEGTPLSGVYGDIDWGGDIHFLKTEINTEGSLVDMGTTQFKTVPYALSSADNQWLKTGNDIENTNTGNVKVNGSLEVGTTLNLELGTTANEISVDGTLADNSDDAIPTEQAVKTYIDNSNNNTVTKIDDLSDGKSDDDGTNNGSSVFLGIDAGLNDDGTDNKNVGMGFETLKNNTVGRRNSSIGYQALHSNIEGNFNTANGFQALYSNEIGLQNTATGYNALYSNTDGEGNTATGSNSLTKNQTGINNTGIGRSALQENTEGYDNTALGYAALVFNTTGFQNTSIGKFSLYNSLTGFNNVAIGKRALFSLNSGAQNTVIGSESLSSLTSGNNNIGIGYNAQPSSTIVFNEVTIGNSANNVYRMYAASWTNASDRQLKHAIKNIPVGLDFVLKLRPVEFIYNNANSEEKTFGFIAQDVKQAVKQFNLEDNILVSPLSKKYLGLRTTELISVLTKAIQEQQEIIKKQDNEIKSLTSELVENKSNDSGQDNIIEKLLKRVEQLESVSNQ